MRRLAFASCFLLLPAIAAAETIGFSSQVDGDSVPGAGIFLLDANGLVIKDDAELNPCVGSVLFCLDPFVVTLTTGPYVDVQQVDGNTIYQFVGGTLTMTLIDEQTELFSALVDELTLTVRPLCPRFGQPCGPIEATLGSGQFSADFAAFLNVYTQTLGGRYVFDTDAIYFGAITEGFDNGGFLQVDAVPEPVPLALLLLGAPMVVPRLRSKIKQLRH